eukprot:TRINITY_DN16265_c0_g1_i1.p1 TRINITY_DN16265_c0_g1~~TRINITY_DN16265_c0_g1_i1.p1  ORF type:complete len:676 (-),score=105.90 TRINITY_DN16265_c0_g1_i1:106-2133(-)
MSGWGEHEVLRLSLVKYVDGRLVMLDDEIYYFLGDITSNPQDFVMKLSTVAAKYSPHRLHALKYIDEEKEWCTLSKDTMADALMLADASGECPSLQILVTFEEPVQKSLEEITGVDFPGNDIKQLPCEDIDSARLIAQHELAENTEDHSAAWCMERKQLWIKQHVDGVHPSVSKGIDNANVTMFYHSRECRPPFAPVAVVPFAAGAHMATSASSSSCSSSQLSVQSVLKELTVICADMDIRDVVPELAGAALKIIETADQPELYQLMDLVTAFRNRVFMAENLPSAIPLAIEVLQSVPCNKMPALVEHFRESATRVVETVRNSGVSQSPPQVVEIHTCVTCDGCGVLPLAGPRYKSLVRQNFDYCKVCFVNKANQNTNEWVRVGCEFKGDVVSILFSHAEVDPKVCFGIKSDGCDVTPISLPGPGQIDSSVKWSSAPRHRGFDVEALTEAQAKSAILALLQHQEESVRCAAEVVLQKCVSIVATEEQTEDEMQIAPAEKDVKQALVPPLLATQAKVMDSSFLMLGIEAQEDHSVRGEVTEQLSAEIAALGGTHGYIVGRIKIPVGLSMDVPVCATIVVQNDGQVAWPDTIVVAHANGDAFGLVKLSLGALNPGEVAEVAMDFVVPPRAGPVDVRSTWTICDEITGNVLGPVLFLEVAWLAHGSPKPECDDSDAKR